MEQRILGAGKGERVEAEANIERSGATYVGPGEGRAVWVLGGQLLTYKVTAEQTGGA
jgi:hypothetical protein